MKFVIKIETLFYFIARHRKDPIGNERKRSRELNAALKHGNTMEAWSRQCYRLRYISTYMNVH